MSLKPLQATMPLGQFDCFDTDLPNITGGEVVTFRATVVPPGDKAAYDVFDGYSPPSSRAMVALLDTGDTAAHPLMLADDGITGYGTLFGSVVGGTVGQVSTGGAVLGPHTATGSGKVTCWAQPGLYAISLASLDATVQPTDAAAVVGVALYGDCANQTGKLTRTSGSNTARVANLVEFATNGSLVTTPNTLAGTFNPPDGALTTTAKAPTFAVIWFQPV